MPGNFALKIWADREDLQAIMEAYFRCNPIFGGSQQQCVSNITFPGNVIGGIGDNVLEATTSTGTTTGGYTVPGGVLTGGVLNGAVLDAGNTYSPDVPSKNITSSTTSDTVFKSGTLLDSGAVKLRTR